jgi:hypothetical protein
MLYDVRMMTHSRLVVATKDCDLVTPKTGTTSRYGRSADTKPRERPSVIWRCEACGTLVHPADERFARCELPKVPPLHPGPPRRRAGSGGLVVATGTPSFAGRVAVLSLLAPNQTMFALFEEPAGDCASVFGATRWWRAVQL